MKITAIYDNEGETFDRYTVCTDERYNDCGFIHVLGLSDNPEHPQGFSQWGSALIGEHLGKKVALDSLPVHIQNHIRDRVLSD